MTLADIASDDTAYAVARAAFEEHSILVLPNQNVTDEIQLAFSRRFGAPEVAKVGSQGEDTYSPPTPQASKAWRRHRHES